MSRSQSDSIVKMNPFEFMLSSLEVTAKKKHEFNSRPPHSEMRFNYLDEWEYAQDVTYLDMFNTFEDELYRNVRREKIFEEPDMNSGESIERAKENDEILSLQQDKNRDSTSWTKYIGSIRYSTEQPSSLTVNHDYDHTLTANDVVLSAMRRHNYNWAYWVQLMVVLGEYSHEKTPVPDMEYLRGLPNAEKMTNFKEIVIRSDENTRSQFENRITRWSPLAQMLDNKVPIQKFYRGFLSQSYLYNGNGFDDCPDINTFIGRINSEQNTGINYPMNPNYVACLIPYTDEERAEGVVPEFAAPSSTMRYTAIQGYSESKKFYSPNYSNMKPQEKDYRRTLCWIPEVRIENGEAVVEFYNSSCCSNISVDVTGRDNDIIFSNDAVTRTRFAERAVQQRNIEKKEAKPEEEPMDSATLAACAYHHEKALIYYNQKRYKDAVTMFAELVQYRYAPSIYYIGLCYLNGTGLTKNDEHAYKFISNAAEHGEPRAIHDLAVLTENGIGTTKDEALAHKYFESAATLDEPRALVEMAHRYLNATMVEQDMAMAETLLKRAAELEYTQAQLEYGKFLIAEGRDGARYIKAAAEAKHPEALLFMYETEQKVGNYKQAYSYAKELHLLGDHRGTKFMADCYYEGKGVSRDKSLAKDLYREAAAAGNEEAKKMMSNNG